MWKCDEALDSKWTLSYLMCCIDETLLLPGAGMPDNAYSLVPYGESSTITQLISNAEKRSLALMKTAIQPWQGKYQK